MPPACSRANALASHLHPITSTPYCTPTPSPLQPLYYVANSLADAKERMRSYCQKEMSVARGFDVRFSPADETVRVDRAVIRGDYTVTMQTGTY